MEFPQNIDSFPQPKLVDRSDSKLFGALLQEHRLSEQEFATLEEIMGRMPTLAELGVFSAMWSEHCSYKSSRVHLGRFPTTSDRVVVGPGENAGVVRIHGSLCAAFKMESHNHPSFIEPFQGAATGVGGILRDVFCMGARPIANLNCLRFGDLQESKTHWLLENSVKGIGDYGNCVGVPTVAGSLSFDSGYNGNCLVNAMTVGLIQDDAIFKGEATGDGNLVVYVGSATGRDGIHGASMASDSFDSSEDGERSAVQVGDPFMEKLLLEATLEALDQDCVVGIQDMGAAGLTSSSFEMADRAGTGLYIDLDKVPLRSPTMSAYEILLSESQERMLMVVEESKWEALEKILAKWELHYGVIGCVTTTGLVQATKNGQLELNVPVAPLAASAPKYSRPMSALAPSGDSAEQTKRAKTYLEGLDLQEVCRSEFVTQKTIDQVYDQYDRHIGLRSVQTSEDGGAAILKVGGERGTEDVPFLGLGVSAGCVERYCEMDPRLGSSHTVLKCARELTAAGAKPIAITDCLNFGNPENPEVMWQFSEAVDGISDACQKLDTPVVSGNVSLYNETDGTSIKPTPMIGMIGICDDVRTATPASGKEGHLIFLLRGKDWSPMYSATSYWHASDGDFTGELLEPNWDAEKEAMDWLLEQRPWWSGARDVGQGGILACAAKMAHSGGVGMEISTQLANADLVSEIPGCWLLSVNPADSQKVFEIAERLSYNCVEQIGHFSSKDVKIKS